MQKALTNGSTSAPKPAKGKAKPASAPAVQSALRTLALENEGLAQIGEELQGAMAVPFSDAVARLVAVKGRVIGTGI